jgi:hypothetical protein
MTTEFTLFLPDEPYKLHTSKGNITGCRYIGPRYLVIRYDLTTKLVKDIDGRTDDVFEYDVSSFTDEGFGFTLFDTTTNPLVAACITGYYEADAPENYTETLPTGEVYSFQYETPTGILGQLYNSFTIKFDPTSNTYSNPESVKVAFTRDEWLSCKLEQIGEIEYALNSQTFSDEDRAVLVSYVKWVRNIETTYPGVDHWKLPVPKNLPSF